MKAKHFKKLRLKLKDKKFLRQEINRLESKLNSWNSFYKFDCNDFFKGYELAERNRKRYTKGYSKTLARLKYIDKHYEKKI